MYTIKYALNSVELWFILVVSYILVSHVILSVTLEWRHNECGGVWNHRPLNGLFNRFFRRRSVKASKFRVTGFCVGNSPVNSPNKSSVTLKMFPLDDVVMILQGCVIGCHNAFEVPLKNLGKIDPYQTKRKCEWMYNSLDTPYIDTLSFKVI